MELVQSLRSKSTDQLKTLLKDIEAKYGTIMNLILFEPSDLSIFEVPEKYQ